MTDPPLPSSAVPDWARPELLGLIAQSSSEFEYVKNAAGQVVYVSPSVRSLLGYTPEECAANWGDIPDWNSPRTLEALSRWEQQQDAEPGSGRVSYLIDVRHRDGSRRTYRIFERWHLDPEGRRFLVGTAADVTDRIDAETSFDRVQELTGIVNYVGSFTPNGLQMDYLGPSYESVFHVSCEESMRDFRAFLAHVHPEDLGPLASGISEAVGGNGPDRYAFRYRVISAEGETRWVSDRGVIERGNDSKPRRLIGLAEDITEQVLAEQEQREREAMQTQAQKLEMVGHLAAGVAHNFSNLLLAIQGYIGLAQRTLGPSHPAIGALAKIEETSEQARGLTRALLTLSHRHPAQRIPLDLSANVEAAIRLLRRTLPTNIAVIPRIEPGVRVLGDASQLDQVVLNAALNARDAMPDGGEITITLSSRNGRAVLVIADDGHGMDGPTRDRAFEPFFTTKSRDDGTGLGLSISRGIVVDHGGEIELSSEPGRGTRLEISLPHLPAEAADPEPAGEPASAGGVVLMLHPPGLIRRVVKTMLDEIGYQVDLLESLSDAEERLGRPGTAGLLIDPAAECLSGHDDPDAALQRLLESADGTGVVIVTDEPDRWRDLRLGPSGVVLPRPFMRIDLAEALTRRVPS